MMGAALSFLTVLCFAFGVFPSSNAIDELDGTQQG